MMRNWLRRWSRNGALPFGLVLALALGIGVAYATTGDEEPERFAIRTNSLGQTETGEIVTVTTPSGEERTLVKWRTREGKTLTEPLGDTVTIAGPGDTVTLPGGATTVLGSGETLAVTEHHTETVQQTQTQVQTQTQTETQVVTVTTPGETVVVTETSPPETITNVVTEVVTETVVVTETLPPPP